MMIVGSASTTLLLRVWTWNDVWVAPAAIVAVVGGVTMSLLPAVPPAVRLMVRALAGAESAETTNVAGWPWGTWLSTDWIVMPGDTWGRNGRYASSVALVDAPPDTAAVVCAAGGPMISPAALWVPTL